MSISKQLCINRFRLPVELLDIIKEFAFYDIKTFEARKCVDRICTMINEGNKNIRNLILKIPFNREPKIVIQHNDTMMSLETLETIRKNYHKCRMFRIWFCQTCGDYEKTSFEDEYGNIFIDDLEFAGCICDKDLSVITRRTLFPLGKVLDV